MADGRFLHLKSTDCKCDLHHKTPAQRHLDECWTKQLDTQAWPSAHIKYNHHRLDLTLGPELAIPNVFISWSCGNQDHQLGGLTNGDGLSHSSRGWTSKVRVSARLAPSEAMRAPLTQTSLLGLYVVVHMFPWPSPCVCTSVQTPPFHKGTSQIGLGPILATSFLARSPLCRPHLQMQP